ncbi:uncharacterized protein LOC115881121 [Sitophilus oryzae]|uniref:Uncharacterized protein LOC115881121 n=1 Tax=Sitophilus oryzae TaxID=7048 RepID=A0A6J2XTL5_SITOR|nr:uncharacterized protein LOC115881121 [Sitophilus oryzae]XP_030754361.1 uncharacterized protein LOC115881121 [Sitophilus oryzae]
MDSINLTCEKCSKAFSRKDNLGKHMKICKGALNSNQPETKNLEKTSLKRTSSPTNINQAEPESSVPKRARLGFNNEHLVMQEEGVYLVKTSYKNRIATYRFLSKKDPISVNDFLANLREKIIALVRCQIERFGNVKVGMELFGRFLL